MVEKIQGQIQKGAEKGQKTYTYADHKNSGQLSDIWFQNSTEGLVLFVVFYSQACRWNRCLGCNLPSKMSINHVDYKALIKQIDNLFSMPEVINKTGEIRKMIISNNGSILDEATFSSTALMYLLAKINLNLPMLQVLDLETRPEYVDLEELEFIARTLQEGDTPTQLEISIGFEAFDCKIRNEFFNKGLELKIFESFVKRIAPYGFNLKCYFMQKPVPGMTDAEGIEDIQAGIRYLSNIAQKYGIAINMHLNPTYVAYGTQLEVAFLKGDYYPPYLKDVAQAVLAARSESLTVFVGLFDEGMAVKDGSFVRSGDKALLAALEHFNRTQNFDMLQQAMPRIV